MKSNYPDSLNHYYLKKSSSFEERTNVTKKIIYYALLAICILLVIMPSLLPFSALLVRILAVIGIIIFGFAAYFGGTEYYNKQSGGKIKRIAIKKFDCSAIDEEELLELFENNNFLELAELTQENNQPLQLYIDEDEVGKVFYLQLMKYFSASDFRGITEVKVITEPEYSNVHKIIKSIKST